MTTLATPATALTNLADKVEMQNRLFAELSAMFGREVPLYDKSLAVNTVTNTAVCSLLSQIYHSFSITPQQLEKTSGERHGAIRIGRPDEYRWIARFFACFAMEPHNFYDMTNVGGKSQPIIATAFRSVLNPEHRVFTSLLMTDYFDPATRARIEALLATRQVFSDRAKELIQKSEQQGGLSSTDGDALVAEGTQRIFKWTARARDHQLYKDLCDAGFKIAADICCFERHHLNHLTPNTFCMDLYTSAMKLCMGEMDEATFRSRATTALTRLSHQADREYMHLTFKHLSQQELDALKPAPLPHAAITSIVDTTVKQLRRPDLDLTKLKHAGFKDSTEGPSQDTPVLLRQDAYKALTEAVTFMNPDGTTTETTHTARFGEIEQRGYATTTKGRALYDQCLAAAEADPACSVAAAKKDFAAYEAAYASHFAAFPKTVDALLAQGLIHARYEPTPKGLAAKGTLATTDLQQLVREGHARAHALRYEDFLPVSAAGIFASNLNQYGTKSTAAAKPTYTQAQLEAIMGKKIVDANAVYAAVEARSILDTLTALGVLAKVPAADQAALRSAAASFGA
ncbi:MAG TPA: DUF1338 family protein [Phycisphaerales bacterium]|nr:DUF1338 family protein [Phycisphaerales bacterium]